MVTVNVVEEEQLFFVPVTVYVKAPSGVLVTELPVLEFRNVEGDQEYRSAPLAVKVLAMPAQVVIFSDAVTVGKEFTVITSRAQVLQLLTPVPVTVYVVVTVGLAVIKAPVVVLSPAAGDQVKESAPLALMPALSPLQRVMLGEGLMIIPMTVIGAMALSRHPVPALLPVTV